MKREGKAVLFFMAYSIIFIAAYFAAYLAVDSRIFYIPGVFWHMPIPVIYWVCAFLYAYIYHFDHQERLKTSFSKLIQPFLLTQVAVLLIDLKVRLAISNPLNNVYTVYIWTIMFSIFSIAAYLASRYIRAWVVDRKNVEAFRVIYLFLFVGLGILLLKHGFFKDSAAMAIVFLGSFFVDAGIVARNCFTVLKNAIMSRWRFILLLYVLALAIRCVFSVIIIMQTGDKFPSGSCDGISYDQNAVLIAHNFRSLIDGSLSFSVFGPYYWIFLGMLYKVFGHNFYVVSFAQNIFGAFLAPIIYIITARLTGDDRMARFSGLATVFCMSLIFLSVVLQPESFFILFLYLFILLLLKYSENGERYIGLAVITGVVFGLMNGTRSIMVLFPALLIIWLLFYAKKSLIRDKIKFFALFLIVSYIVTLPAEIMYSKEKEKYKGISSTLVMSQGALTYQLNNPELANLGFNPFSNPVGSVKAFFTEPKKVGYYFVKAAAVNIHRFFFVNFFGYFNPFILVLPSKYPNYFGAYMLFYLYGLIILGAVRFFFKGFRKDAVWLFVFLFIYYFISHPLFFEIRNARHRSPLHPFFIILFSIGFYFVWDWLQKHSGERL